MAIVAGVIVRSPHLIEINERHRLMIRPRPAAAWPAEHDRATKVPGIRLAEAFRRVMGQAILLPNAGAR
jgi:hypothetical protein